MKESREDIIKLTDLCKWYHAGLENELEALHNLNLEIARGEMVAITGRSGSGKSTLLRILCGLLPYEAGSCFVSGICMDELTEEEKTRFRNQKIGVVMQDFALIEEFTAMENVRLPLDFSAERIPNKKKRVQEALELAGIPELENKLAGELSGGQKQRVAIARAIVNQPEILLADEPTGALDSDNTQKILELFQRLNQMGKTVLMVTHDQQAAGFCRRRIRLHDGVIAEDWRDGGGE